MIQITWCRMSVELVVSRTRDLQIVYNANHCASQSVPMICGSFPPKLNNLATNKIIKCPCCNF
eukprot:4936585-Amphidinium_carterae.1